MKIKLVEQNFFLPERKGYGRIWVAKKFAKKPPKLSTIKLKTVGGFDICHTTSWGPNDKRLSLFSGG